MISILRTEIRYRWWRKSNHVQWGSSWDNLWGPVRPSPDARWHEVERNLHRWGLCGRRHHLSRAQYRWSYQKRKGRGQPKEEIQRFLEKCKRKEYHRLIQVTSYYVKNSKTFTNISIFRHFSRKTSQKLEKPIGFQN